MSGLTLIRADGARLVLDAVPEGSTTHTVTATDHAVERGAEVTDNLQRALPRFAVTGLVTYEGPLAGSSTAGAGRSAGAAAGVSGGSNITESLSGVVRQDVAEAFLLELLGETCTVVWRGRLYRDVAILELVLPQTTRTALTCEIAFRQLRIVSSATTRLPAQVRRTKPGLTDPGPKGEQPKPPATPTQVKLGGKSLAAAGADTDRGSRILNFFGLGGLSKRGAP